MSARNTVGDWAEDGHDMGCQRRQNSANVFSSQMVEIYAYMELSPYP